eukprot:100486-Pyramimonas_sp.AAC.1
MPRRVAVAIAFLLEKPTVAMASSDASRPRMATDTAGSTDALHHGRRPERPYILDRDRSSIV